MIRTKPATKEYRNNFDNVFKRRKAKPSKDFHENLRQLEARNHADQKIKLDK